MKRIFDYAIAITLITGLLVTGCTSGKKEQADQDKASQKDSTKSTSEDYSGITVPDGFEATVVADTLGEARDLAVKSNGDIYTLLRNPRNGYCMAAIRDKDQDGEADSIAYFGEHCGRGSVIIKGNYLYHSTDTSVLRTKFMSKDELVPSGKTEALVKGFEFHGEHGNKTFAIDGKDNLYLSVGAPSNACQKKNRQPGSMGQDPCPLLKKYGGIWKFDANKKNQTQSLDQRFATGIRNVVAITWNNHTNNLYAVQHGRDQLNQFFPEKFTKEQSAKLPAEEMFLINEDDNFGWPYCYYDGLKDKKVLAPEYGGDGDSVGRCSKFEDPVAHFPAHFAPNNLIFYGGKQFPKKYRNGAFIAFHGSWNRNEHKQWGYNVTFVPFDGKKPSGDHQTFADDFEGPDRVSTPDSAKHRPCGLAEGPDGSLYVSDDVKGRLWKIAYTGEK